MEEFPRDLWEFDHHAGLDKEVRISHTLGNGRDKEAQTLQNRTELVYVGHGWGKEGVARPTLHLESWLLFSVAVAS